jgi:hypothetical protein
MKLNFRSVHFFNADLKIDLALPEVATIIDRFHKEMCNAKKYN